MSDEELQPLIMRKQYTLYRRSMMKDGNSDNAPVQIERPIYKIEELNREHLYEKPYHTLKSYCQKAFQNVDATSCIKQTIPILSWLPQYNWRKSFSSDVISGLTVAIMHIPQGMAYGLLGNVPPITGIYMAFLPVLTYFIFGTSRHVSIGTFALICLLTGKVVTQYTTVEVLANGTLVQLPNQNPSNDDSPSYTNIEVAITVTFVTALMQLAMYVLRLGIVSQLLSETLVNAFTCAAAFHVVASQLKDLLGLNIKKRRGNFSVPLTIYDSIMALPTADITSVTVSSITIALLVLNDQILKPWMAKKTRIPFPIEWILVVLGTVVSYFMKFEKDYGVTTVGYIPKGFPSITIPAFDLIPNILVDCFVITMVSYTVSLSMALIFARKLMYEVDSNQELMALGFSNIVGSFFSCMPVCASLSRSMIQMTTGGVTQIASVISCGVLTIILLWVGTYFQDLPRCVLASIILVALKSMLIQALSFPRFWRLSRWDGIVWLVTFLTTVLVQISYGLAAGVVVSLTSVFVQGYTPYTCLLGVVPNTDLYLDIKRYKGALEIEGVKIFHYSGGLSFASVGTFKELLIRKTQIDAAAILRRRIKLNERGIETEDDLFFKCIILDFSCLTFVDPSGVDSLKTIQEDYERLGISMYITGCSGPVYEVIEKCDKITKNKKKFVIFPTVHDAVLFSLVSMDNSTES